MIKMSESQARLAGGGRDRFIMNFKESSLGLCIVLDSNTEVGTYHCGCKSFWCSCYKI